MLSFAAAALHAIALTKDGRTAVTASADFRARCYDLTTGQCTATLEGHSGWVTDVKITPSGRTAVTASHDHTARCCLHHPHSSAAALLVNAAEHDDKLIAGQIMQVGNHSVQSGVLCKYAVVAVHAGCGTWQTAAAERCWRATPAA
jgi:WD40 repeat protein